MPQTDVQNAITGLPDFDKVELSDVIDAPALQEMMDDYYALTGFAYAILDIKGKVLVSGGWQDICVKYHRAVPESCAFCLESDTSLSSGVPSGTFKEYHCKNSMWDIASPIMLGDRHIGNIFLGQFLYDDEEPDYELFRAQARRFGYNEAEYLAALERVPRYSRKTVKAGMSFCSKLAQMISKSNYNNVILAKTLARQEQVENKLKEREHLLTKAQEISHLGSWSLDLTTNRLIWSDEIFRIFGLQQQEFAVTYETFLDAVHPEDRDAVNSAYIGSIQEGKNGYEIEHRVIRKDTGQTRYVYEKCEHIRDASGKIIRSEGMVHDITERKQSEDALRESEKLYRSLFENMLNGFAYCQMHFDNNKPVDFTYLSVNSAFETLTGLRDVVGKKVTEVIPGIRKSDQELLEIYGRVAKTGESEHFEMFIVALQMWFLISVYSLERNYFVSVFDVITESKQAEQKLLESNRLLNEAKEQAEAANIAKSRFLATMSHEIRTPMNGVIGMLELLQHTELTQQQQEYAESAKKSGVALVQLLNDILDLSKIEADRIELELSAFDLRSLISDTIKLMSLQAREKGVELVSSIHAEVPATLKGDASRLRQIITNLVGNAIKFTHKGSVTLHVQKEAEDEHSVILRFLVRDSGIGIAAGKLEHIFKPFTQADSSTTRKFGGTGLGLAICKRLSELMGGSIGAESAEGEGSTFWFTVVLEKLAEGTLATPKPPSAPRRKVLTQAAGSGRRLLLAEDDPIARQIVSELLKIYGYLVDVANDGKEALQALEKNDYALVLMDCMMPEINGYEVTAVIRDPASAVRRHDIPVIALTGNAMKQDSDRCIAAGMNDHLPKPLALPDLLAKLEQWLNR